MELTHSVVKDGKFYLGQEELSLIIKRIIKVYNFQNNNQEPDAVVIPLLKSVGGVDIEYEQAEKTKTKGS